MRMQGVGVILALSGGWFVMAVLGHVLKHVPKHVLRHMLDKHVLNRLAHAVLMT